MIYHSKKGNCRAVCDDVGKKLKEKYDVKISSVKEIKPDDIASNPPDVLIIGSRIVIGSPDKTIKGFLKKLGKVLKHPIPKAATIYTHCLDWDNKFAKMAKILKEERIATEVIESLLEIKLAKMKGPIESGQELKIETFVQKLFELA